MCPEATGRCEIDHLRYELTPTLVRGLTQVAELVGRTAAIELDPYRAQQLRGQASVRCVASFAAALCPGTTDDDVGEAYKQDVPITPQKPAPADLSEAEKTDLGRTCADIEPDLYEAGKQGIATLDGETASIALREVGPEHPFYSLSGSDNIISFQSERYHDRPLVVKGPGAGAEVTAAGVFADVIRISNYLLWQIAYTELWITDVLWPDFDKCHLETAIKAFQNRERRFGKVKEA